jgi:hypothetical protein
MFFLRRPFRAHTAATNNMNLQSTLWCSRSNRVAAVCHSIGSPGNRRCSLAQVRPVRRRQPTGSLKHAAMQNHDPPFQWTKDLQLSIPCWQSTWMQKFNAWNSPNEICPIWLITNKTEGHSSLRTVTSYGLTTGYEFLEGQGFFFFYCRVLAGCKINPAL